MTFGNKLKLIRQKNGWSQSDLARRLNTSKQVISRYENEQTTPKITVGVQYAKTLGVPINLLLDDEKDLFEKEISEEVSPQDNQIIRLLFNLTVEEQKEALNYIKFISKHNQDT